MDTEGNGISDSLDAKQMEAKKPTKLDRLIFAGIIVVVIGWGVYYIYRQDSADFERATGRSERQPMLSTVETKISGEKNAGNQSSKGSLSWTANGYHYTRHEAHQPFKYRGAVVTVDSMAVVSSICCYEENPVIGDSPDTRYIDYNTTVKKPYRAAKWAEFVVVAWHYANESGYPIPDINHEFVMLYDTAEEKMLNETTGPTQAYVDANRKLKLHFGGIADKLDPESEFHTVSAFEVAKKNADPSNLAMTFVEDKEVSIIKLGSP